MMNGLWIYVGIYGNIVPPKAYMGVRMMSKMFYVSELFIQSTGKVLFLSK